VIGTPAASSSIGGVVPSSAIVISATAAVCCTEARASLEGGLSAGEHLRQVSGLSLVPGFSKVSVLGEATRGSIMVLTDARSGRATRSEEPMVGNPRSQTWSKQRRDVW
jgi:hypothetical protein